MMNVIPTGLEALGSGEYNLPETNDDERHMTFFVFVYFHISK